jgi:hypothetical protein
MAARLRSHRRAYTNCAPVDPRAGHAGHGINWPIVLVLSMLAVGCASAPLDQVG